LFPMHHRPPVHTPLYPLLPLLCPLTLLPLAPAYTQLHPFELQANHPVLTIPASAPCSQHVPCFVPPAMQPSPPTLEYKAKTDVAKCAVRAPVVQVYMIRLKL
jgi:hypothetical protein